MFKLRDLEKLYDKLITTKEKRFTINGVEYSLIENEIGTMLIKSDIYDNALDDKLKEEIKNYEDTKK